MNEDGAESNTRCGNEGCASEETLASRPAADPGRAHNLMVLRRGGPRITDEYLTCVVARDRQRRLVLLSGLGCMGVGQMWLPDCPLLQKETGYVEAPELVWDPDAERRAWADSVEAEHLALKTTDR